MLSMRECLLDYLALKLHNIVYHVIKLIIEKELVGSNFHYYLFVYLEAKFGEFDSCTYAKIKTEL